MATSNNTIAAPVIYLFTGKPLAQGFIDDPELFALACEEDCLWMSDEDLADMDEQVEYEMYLDRMGGVTISDAELEAAIAARH